VIAMNVQMVRRLEGAFKVHLVEEGAEAAICGATSTSGWDGADPAEGATCPACQARLTSIRRPVTVQPLPGAVAPLSPSADPPHVEPYRRRPT
jgi:hypothetical protein